MRWDRKIRIWVAAGFETIGQPIFWLVYWSWQLVEKMAWKLKVVREVVNRRRKKRNISGRRKMRGLMLGVLGLTGILVMSFWWWVLRDLPKPHELLTRQQALTTKIYDRHGILLYKLFKNQNRSVVPLSSLPRHVIEATLAIEDAEFYQHPGFSVRGISRAIRANMNSDSLQGGSTITQQLVKNALLTPERTLVRKLKEFVLAMEVEYFFTKDEILSMYINEVGYGGTVYGIEEAANYYFGKSARDLSVAEAALIAGLPASPTTYSPFGSRPDLAIARKNLVLRRMMEEKMLTREEMEAAQAEELKFGLPTSDILAPHFVMYVKEWLVDQYGEAMVQSGGLEVITSLDYGIQRRAQEAIEQELGRLAGMNVNNGAVMVTRPQTGEILVMVGSKDYFDTETDGQVNVTLSSRQPGSSIKPLTYALAMEKGAIKASTLIDDAPISYQVPGSPVYSPQNYDGQFHGKVTVRRALANSYNVPAVKVLAQVGVSQLVEFGKKMGITTWEDSSRFGLSLTLGGGEIKMADMAVAYGVLANGGYKAPLVAVLRVTDYRGKPLYKYDCQNCPTEKVVSAETAFMISDILSDNEARSAAFGVNSVLSIKGKKVAVKTGTTNDLRDNWTIGYTPDYLVAAWVGNNDNQPMSRVASGITGASPIWRTIMQGLLDGFQGKEFVAPDSLIKVGVCVVNQMLACDSCPMVVEEYFVAGTEPTTSCKDEVVASPTPAVKDDKPRDKILDGTTDLRRRKRD